MYVNTINESRAIIWMIQYLALLSGPKITLRSEALPDDPFVGKRAVRIISQPTTVRQALSAGEQNVISPYAAAHLREVRLRHNRRSVQARKRGSSPPISATTSSEHRHRHERVLKRNNVGMRLHHHTASTRNRRRSGHDRPYRIDVTFQIAKPEHEAVR